MKTTAYTILALCLILLAIWITLTIGHSLVAKICIWIGLLVLFSIKFASTRINHVLLFARIGLLFNVLAMLVLTLSKHLIITRGWYENPRALELFSKLRWVVDSVPAILEYMVNNKNWGIDIFPEYATLYFVFADYINLLLQILLFSAVLSAAAALLKWLKERSGQGRRECKDTV